MQLLWKLLAAFWNWLQLVQISNQGRFNFWDCAFDFWIHLSKFFLNLLQMYGVHGWEGRKEGDLSSRIEHLNALLQRSKKAAKKIGQILVHKVNFIEYKLKNKTVLGLTLFDIIIWQILTKSHIRPNIAKRLIMKTRRTNKWPRGV